jgi:hypothetical protein
MTDWPTYHSPSQKDHLHDMRVIAVSYSTYEVSLSGLYAHHPQAKKRHRPAAIEQSTALVLDLGGEDRDRLRDHLVEEFGELHCKLGHAVRIEPGLRRRSPKNGNISSIRRRLAANPSRK